MVLNFVWLNDKLSLGLLKCFPGGVQKPFHHCVLNKGFANQINNVDLFFNSLESLLPDQVVLSVAKFVHG